MALDTFTNLKTAVLRHAARPGDSYLEAALPDLVTLCESRIHYGSASGGLVSEALRTQDMEARVTATVNEEYEDLPTDWLEMRSLKLLTTPVVDLEYRTPQQFDREYAGNGGTGQPRIYTITGRQLRFGPAPGSASYTAEMGYYAKVPALGPDMATNWLLTKAPGIYLYGTLLELAPMIKADDRLAGWFALFAGAIGGLQTQDRRARSSGASLAVRTDSGNPP